MAFALKVTDGAQAPRVSSGTHDRAPLADHVAKPCV